MPRRTLTACAVLAAVAIAAAPAQALEPCPGPAPTARVLLSDQGTLESAIVDARGRLLYAGAPGLMRLDAPGAQPVHLLDAESPGGMVLDDDGRLIMGYGDSIPNGATAELGGRAGLLRIDTDTGESTVYATGLGMANGVARGPDGAIYATNDAGASIDKVVDGHTIRAWARVLSSNGAVVDPTGRWLIVAQTFQPAAIQRVELANPAHVEPLYAAQGADILAGLDGMAQDAAGRLYIAANRSGELWRVDPGNPVRPCLVLGGLPAFPDGPSMVVIGRGGGPFPATSLYVVTFDGTVYELPGAVPASPRRLRLTVRPDGVRTGRRTRFVFTVRPEGRPVAGARIRFAGLAARTGRHGRATIVTGFAKPGLRTARAVKRGWATGTAGVRVVRQRGPTGS